MHGVEESTESLPSFLHPVSSHLLNSLNVKFLRIKLSLCFASYVLPLLAEFLYVALTCMVICCKLNSNIFTIIVVSYIFVTTKTL